MTRLALLAAPALLTACASGNPSLSGRTTHSSGAISNATTITDSSGRTAWRIECTQGEAACISRANLICGGAPDITRVRARTFRKGAGDAFASEQDLQIPEFAIIASCP